jgi:uncharacterized protein (DUF2141 family)
MITERIKHSFMRFLQFIHKNLQLSQKLYVKLLFRAIFESSITNEPLKRNIMKSLFLTITFVIISTLGFAQDKKGHTITVTVENFTNNTGKAGIALHTSNTFLKAPGVQSLETKIVDGKATFTFENVVSGEYALLVLHDKNENGRMDYAENGMPTESYGTSNNVRAFGPPQYEDAKFKVDSENLELSIRL